MKQDPKPNLSRAALEACATYWEAQVGSANKAKEYADSNYAEATKQRDLLNENQTTI